MSTEQFNSTQALHETVERALVFIESHLPNREIPVTAVITLANYREGDCVEVKKHIYPEKLEGPMPVADHPRDEITTEKLRSLLSEVEGLIRARLGDGDGGFDLLRCYRDNGAAVQSSIDYYNRLNFKKA